ncbi:ArsR family transcriptional regulator [Filobacillus milosensis]|uniref:ArsR family transcriptional regulator n=1 Tax=Filobacillus milosensis TaxID=94137 RepID=A0A4Y8IC90_9BACI|nr:winged helix-turn-helix domain-containing protein [Filobacillus milosensis]TFB13487.1 ArsR family transcriptional regulator [Filobacillus milosensis]
MDVNPNMALVAAIISDKTRSKMIFIMLDGRFHSASELAYMAGIKPQTATFHLKKMTEAQIIKVEKQGRHKYFGIKDPGVASVLETFLSIAPQFEVRSLKKSPRDKALRSARTCYDHLAGNLGVKLVSALEKKGVLVKENDKYEVTNEGIEFLATLQINIYELKKKRRSFSHKCLDWSERKHHMGGALGNAIFEKILEFGWIKRLPNTRAIKITTLGEEHIPKIFNIDL